MPPKQTADKPHPGFDKHGDLFYSETPVTNPVTIWVWKACSRIPADHLTPCMVVELARQDGMLELFSPTILGNWSTIDRFHLWPIAWGGSPLAQTLKQHGKSIPPWNDEWSWGRLCDSAEDRHDHPSRFGGHHHNPQELVAQLARSWPTQAEDDVREKVEAQLDKARAAGLIP